MTPIDCMILEDDAMAAGLLEHLITADDRLKPFCTLTSFEDAVTQFKLHQAPGILFLDVELGGRSGLEIMPHVPASTSVILTTANELYAYDGYEIGAIDFLKKPVTKERFTKAVDKALLFYTTASPVYVTISSGKQVYRFQKETIYSVESLKDYVRINTTDSSQLLLCTMKYLEDLLEPLGFLRISKSCMINLQHFSSVKGTQIILNNGIRFTAGRSYRQKVKSILLPPGTDIVP